MLEDIHFSFDGVKSSDMGLINCRIEGGMFDESFLASSSIRETKIAGRDKAYFLGVDYDPLEFDLTFAFEDRYDERKIREVARWLGQRYYKPFYTVGNPNRIFYCILDGDSNLVHDGSKGGYIKLKFRCDSPYAYQPITVKDDMKFTNTKIVKSYVENTFSSGTKYENLKSSSGKLEVDIVEKFWTDYTGESWSDIV